VLSVVNIVHEILLLGTCNSLANRSININTNSVAYKNANSAQTAMRGGTVKQPHLQYHRIFELLCNVMLQQRNTRRQCCPCRTFELSCIKTAVLCWAPDCDASFACT
jgi:hypothetical protein